MLARTPRFDVLEIQEPHQLQLDLAVIALDAKNVVWGERQRVHADTERRWQL